MKFLIGKNYLDEVIPLINNAKTNIDILAYHWGYYSFDSKTKIHLFTSALKSAIIRGVNIRVLIHSGNPADNLRRVNSDTVNHLRAYGVNVKYFRPSGTLHAKLILIDKTIAILGSHNISKRAMSSNIEISIMIEGSGDIRPVQDYFNLIFR